MKVPGLSSLSIGRRLLASICFFSLPLGVLFLFNLDQISTNISFATSEIAGNEYQSAPIKLVKALGDYRLNAVCPSRNADICIPGLAAAKGEVDALFQTLEDRDRALGAKLGFTGAALKEAGLDNLQVSLIRSKWQTMTERSQGPDSKEASDRYEDLVSDLRGMISHAGDTSNLTLDPEMDSYYLADVTSVSSAQTLNRLSAAMLVMEPLLREGAPAAGGRTQAAVYEATFKESDFDRIAGDLDTAFKENLKAKRGASPTLKPNTQLALARYKEDMARFLSLLADVSGGKAVTREEFHKAAARASQSSLELWEKTADELTLVLKMRIGGFSWYRKKLIFGLVVSLALAIAVFAFVVRGIVVPLGAAVEHVGRISGGDVSRDMPEKYLARRDEIGVLARAMQAMSGNLRAMIKEISGGVRVLAGSSATLAERSTEMTSGSQDASRNSHSVAAAAEEMSSTFTSVAIGMEQTTTNLANVAAAAEEMTATIGQIASNSEKARHITGEATRQAAQITEKINQLSRAASEIGKVTETINEISAQTNLLALNATIEAARAGVAGKGFAVVANEIKALAQQTAGATEDIRTRIGGVQSATEGGAAEIAGVSNVIRDVNEIVGMIAAAIEEQSATTREIARNITEASAGVADTNRRVAETSQVSRNMATDITSVHRSAAEIAVGSTQVHASAEGLAQLAGQLESMLKQFQCE